MPGGTLDGLRVLAFEARRAEELATMLARHGATVTRAPALREAGLPASPEADELVLELRRGHIWTVILLTGVGTRALAAAVAAACPEFPQLLARTTLIARGPKPLAALRELGVGGAHPVPSPHTWREVLGVVDALDAARGRGVAVQEYGVPNPWLVDALRVGTIAGAALDVYEREPDVEDGLRSLDNVVLTPHLGSATRETRVAMGMLCVEGLRAVLLDSRIPANAVVAP